MNAITDLTKRYWYHLEHLDSAKYYYGDGYERVKKTENGKITLYFFSEYEEEYTGLEPAAKVYYFLNGQRVAQITKRVHLEYLHQDHLGSTILVTDNSGNPKESETYKPYGEGTMGTLTINYKWTGGETDSSGLYYFNARYYSPETGRFISVDPAVITKMDVDLSIEEICNPYMYARNNPIRYTDPTGLHDEIAIFISYKINGDGSVTGSYKARDSEGNYSKGTFSGRNLGEIYNPDKQPIHIRVSDNSGTVTYRNTDIQDAIQSTVNPTYDSGVLGSNLIRQGESKPGFGYQAHHIVPGNHPDAISARNILDKYGIDINHAENGVWLSREEHAKTFTRDYMDSVTEALQKADAVGTRQAVLDTLVDIKAMLKLPGGVSGGAR